MIGTKTTIYFAPLPASEDLWRQRVAICATLSKARPRHVGFPNQLADLGRDGVRAVLGTRAWSADSDVLC